MSELKIICIFYPDRRPIILNSLFVVVIKCGYVVSELKDAIKLQNANQLKGINACDLTLYKASVENNQLKQTLQGLKLGSEEAPELDNPLLVLSDVFPDLERGHLHVIVTTPGMFK